MEMTVHVTPRLILPNIDLTCPYPLLVLMVNSLPYMAAKKKY